MPCFSSLTVLARHGSGFRSLEHRLGQSDARKHLSEKQNNKENNAKIETAIELAAVGKDEAATGGGLAVQGMGLVEGVLQHGLGRISGKPQVCELWHMQMTSRSSKQSHTSAILRIQGTRRPCCSGLGSLLDLACLSWIWCNKPPFTVGRQPGGGAPGPRVIALC